MKRVAVIAGDGIGPEVIEQAVQTIELAAQIFHIDLAFTRYDWGADKYIATGVSLPPGALEMLSRDFDAILSGAFGGTRMAFADLQAVDKKIPCHDPIE